MIMPMNVVKIYEEDIKIKDALLDFENKELREKVTRDFFFRQCFSNFKYVYEHYYTDCDSVIEFINEIYKLVMSPGVKSGQPALSTYRGESKLETWLQNVSVMYCNRCYKKKQQMPIYEPIISSNDENETDSGRDEALYGTNTLDTANIDVDDVERILALMPNKRYREIIRLFYLNGETNESAAAILGMTKANFYNKKILAEAQYLRVFKKEERHG